MSQSHISRRRALKGAAALAAALATTAVATGFATAEAGTGAAAGTDTAGHEHGTPDPRPQGRPAEFDEVYRDRRIQGMDHSGSGGGHTAHGAHATHGDGYTVLVDGRPLHVMRNADGTWISVVNHYETFATPRALARAAVDELNGAALLPIG